MEKMASSKGTCKRDWGKGMACVGRTKICSIVPADHFGPIPGIPVGSHWKYRMQVSEDGVHRPHVAGIHGSGDRGSYSIVLSGGYEDDEDRGEEFLYTGAGGRDLSGNKRTAEQSCDQTLTRTNLGLARCCDVPINKKGAEAKDWKAGKPVRVVRSEKLKKHSEFAPDEGCRYDGIYKVVKYWPEKGKSKFIVWRYLLRRDDPAPAPWTKEGKKEIQKLGLTIQYPEGHLEAMKMKEQNKENAKSNKEGKKRKQSKESSEIHEPKRVKAAEYEIEGELKSLIKIDKSNEKSWKNCVDSAVQGMKHFLSVVQESFECICCQSLVVKPCTTPCQHNVCQSCLKRSFAVEVFSCPTCRHELGKKFDIGVNKSLSKALYLLFPGYDAGK